MRHRTVTPLPDGFRVTLDRRTRELAPGIWSGGSPVRVVRLTAAGSAVWRGLSGGPVDSAGAGLLARRLTDAGLAHPCPPPVPAGTAEVTVVIPVRDRPGLLDRCLAALDGRYPVVVVDDGSRDPAAVAAVAAARGAKLVARGVCGGPAAARNTGLDHVTTDLVAFVDSDCVPAPGWIDTLAAHLADPMVAAVAPRITAVTDPAAATGRYTRVAETLDMGPDPHRVAPRTRLPYVPTAAIIARRAALYAVARPGGVFDPAMQTGEDVDLVWRLHAAGWRIRYDPSVRVGHHEPTTWSALLARRLRYGASAAPLALRHPGNIPPLIVGPWPALTVAAILGRRPAAAAAAFGLSVLATRRVLRAHDLPAADAWRVNTAAVSRTWLGVGQYATQYAAPVLLACLLGRGRGRWGRRATAVSLLVGPGLARWARHPRVLDPVRTVVASVADDIAYGAGVWAGCVTHRTVAPLRPYFQWQTHDLPRKRGPHE